MRSPRKLSKLEEMKAFFFSRPLIRRCILALLVPIAAVALSSTGRPALAAAAEDPVVAGPLTELRKAPLFTSEIIPLAKTWGLALPMGTRFQVQKVYGRWVFGKPSALSGMHARDFAPPGWLYSRTLLMPGDSDTLAPSVVQSSRALLFHARALWKKLELGKAPLRSSLDFLETLTLSRGTLAAFSKPEEGPASSRWLPFQENFLPEASAEEAGKSEEGTSAPMGLTGTDLSFLDQEIEVLQSKKKNETIKRIAKKLKIPPAPILDDTIRRGLLGRYLLERYLELPPLTLEEVDGFIYMRATAQRALLGCPKQIQDHWKKRRWNFLRIYRLKSRSEEKNPWFEIALPGGYFALSGRAIELAGNEAELAFLLVRQLVRDLHVTAPALHFNKKSWPGSLKEQSEEVWDKMLKSQSTKDSENLDVSDEIEVDMQAIECLGRAGYRPLAAIAYLKKLTLNREQPWAAWFTKHSIGLEYRIERVLALTQESLAHQKFPEGKDSQTKRFAAAAKQWNILP